MCGRYAADFSVRDLSNRFDLSGNQPVFQRSYNITPAILIPVVVCNSPKTVMLMKWGFVPKWADPVKIKISPINARSETLLTSGFYKDAFINSRCLIPFSWFYEWKKIEVDGKIEKTPYLIKLKNEPIMGFAGIYSEKKDAENRSIFTCAIITTKPNDLISNIHDRMPVIIDKKHENTWLNKDSEPEDLNDLLSPFESNRMEAYKISTKVNNSKNNNPDLAKPV